MMPNKVDFLIVGAGFSGAVAARVLAEAGRSVRVLERRNHLAGNCFDSPDEAGILLHRYGPHYFRTNSQAVIDFLSRFTEWMEADYRVQSWADGRLWSFPVNLVTFEQMLGRASSPEEMTAQLEAWRVPVEQPRNSEEVIVSQVGWELYEKFFKNYTRKQWQRDPKELDASVCGRIPIRTTRDERYFGDQFQKMPREGYTRMIERMLEHPNIEVRLGVDYLQERQDIGHVIYTGAIDEFYAHRFGQLPYRSLRFEAETLGQEWFQPVVQVNYPNDHAYTRIVEIKHVNGQNATQPGGSGSLPQTTIVREYPEPMAPGREPYYPIPAPDAAAQYAQYAALAAQEPRTTFLGRLATYRYLNMDQVVAEAMETAGKLAAGG